MTNSLRIIMIPLGLAALTLLVIALTLPLGASARAATAELQPALLTETGDLPQARVNAVQVLPGTDVALSGAGGRLPDIAANGEFAAVVFQVGNASSSRVYIRAAQTGSGWGFTKQLDTLQGESPKLAFRNGVTNTVYVVWAGQSGQYIKFTTCTLTDPTITCAAAANVNNVAATDSSFQLQLPDIAVDSSNNIHLAWVNRGTTASNDNMITTARRPSTGGSWTTTSFLLLGGDNGGQPVLATAGSWVHLAYKDYESGGDVWSVRYRRSGTGSTSHSWVNPKEYFDTTVVGYGRMGNPALAATGTKVYLAWDNQNDPTGGDLFALTGDLSSDSGVNWADNPYGRNITSANRSDAGDPDDQKGSYEYETAVPVEEEGLRPSLAVNGSGNFAIVWQQRPLGGSLEPPVPGNCTSEVFYAPDSAPWSDPGWGTVTADTETNYSIDPDIAIDGNGTHVVFMQAPDNACNGGNVGDYIIYYRGPFDSFSTKGSRVYLPIVLKNS